MTQSDPNARCTASLVFTVLIVSFGSWFHVGYTTFALNGPQNVIVNWIRSTQCIKFGSLSTNTSIPWNISTVDADLYLWCRHITEEDEDSSLLSDNLHLNTLWALASSAVNIGWFLSIFFIQPLLTAFSLKNSILVEGVLCIVSTVIFSVAPFVHSYELFVIGRILTGTTGGIYMVVASIYISEITPVRLRGTLGSIPMVLTVLGMACATAVGFPSVLGNYDGWMYLMSVGVISTVLLLFIFPFCPDSPRQLYIAKKDLVGARKALVWFRQTDNVEGELNSMQAELDLQQTHHSQVSMIGLFRDKQLRSTLWLCVVAMIARQFSGYAVISSYSTAMFTRVGLDQQGALWATMGVWGVSLVGSLLSLILVDWAGRKTLLLIAHAGLIVSILVFIVFSVLNKEGYSWTAYGSVACLFAVMFFYQAGLASVTFILPTELFTQEARSAGISISTGVAAACAVITTFLFPVLESLIQEYAYSIFIGVLLITSVYIAWKLPETKGKTISEIQAILKG